MIRSIRSPPCGCAEVTARPRTLTGEFLVVSSERAGISERAYALHADISRGAVRNARAADRLVLLAVGSIDAAASDARRTETADPARQPFRQITGYARVW